jgi:hypothetical protein
MADLSRRAEELLLRSQISGSAANVVELSANSALRAPQAG